MIKKQSIMEINNEKETEKNVNEEYLKNNILDFSLDNELRTVFFEKYFHQNEDNCLEILNRLCGIYQFSGMKVLETFLFQLSENKKISGLFKIEACKGLFLFEEIEDEITKFDDKETIEFKNEYNKEIQLRNLLRKEKAYDALNISCSKSYDLETLPTPYRVDSICLLMKAGEKYQSNCDTYFRDVIKDFNIGCDYRYKCILNLEKMDILDHKFYIKNACMDFLVNMKNMTMYRILAAQYLLQNYELDDDTRIDIQNIILSFAEDNQLDYDLRADAADLLLNLGTDHYKNLGREIIMLLGRIDGNVKTIYDNRQNVHTKEIEKSVIKTLNIITSYPSLKIGKEEIDYNFVFGKIQKILKDEKIEHKEKEEKEESEILKCKNCNKPVYTEEETEVEIYCSIECEKQFTRHEKINLSLNRIYMDRTLYINNTLSKILVKIWSYIDATEYKDEMIKRLLEELEEMSGTCSSGFLSRLINSISGFGDFILCISFEDQLVSNFIGRLNSYTRKITEPGSPFYNEKLYDMMELHFRDNNMLKYKPNCIPIKILIDDYLNQDREYKIKNAIEEFSEKVINEMTVNTIKINDRRHFSLFFITYLPNLRHELWEEFKEYMDDFTFDLVIRKSISLYEGLQHFV
jgi:hypothetical protein